jgi:hypothetical protein
MYCGRSFDYNLSVHTLLTVRVRASRWHAGIVHRSGDIGADTNADAESVVLEHVPRRTVSRVRHIVGVDTVLGSRQSDRVGLL